MHRTPVRREKEFYEKDNSALNESQIKTKKWRENCTDFLGCTVSNAMIFGDSNSSNISDDSRRGRCIICNRLT